MATKTYTVKSTLNHDQKDYPAGSTIELDDADAAPLLAGGAVEPGKAAANESAPEGEVVRIAAIKDAIGKLNIDSAELWLKDGRPDVKAVEAITGWPVKAAERDAAWGELQSAE